MKYMCVLKTPLIIVLLLSTLSLHAQVELSLQVDSATIVLTCGDAVGNPEPMWGVNVNQEGFGYYPAEGPCFLPVPNQHYLQSGSCPADLGSEIEVCFQGFENDPFIGPPISCEISPDCTETICETFSLPPPGSSRQHSLDLPADGSVTGTLFFTIDLQSTSNIATNDRICDAIDLGTLGFGSSLGDAAAPVYNNYCATNNNEPNPFDVGVQGSFINDQGVWFTFRTGNQPSGIILIDVFGDPQQTGDDFDAQVAAYTFSEDACNGAPTLVRSNSDNSSFNVRLKLKCPEPDQLYYLLVDGGNFGNESTEGPFTIQITDPGIPEGGDLRCDFEDLGVVPEGGQVQTDGFRSNFCGTDVQDPFVAAFVSQHSVWYSFVAPPSGHVIIEAISDTIIEPIGAQLAIFQSFNQTCNGGYRHLKSQFTGNDLDESMEVSCLYEGRRYYVLVDGSGDRARGIFTLSIRDAGDITPVTVVDTILCPGKTLRVGNNVYNATGTYVDTLQVREGCDSIVISNVLVADPITVEFEQTRLASEEGRANAEARVIVSGGVGTPRITWCDGQQGPTATGLVGGTECCITIADSLNCLFYQCYEINYIQAVIPLYQDTTVACYGDEDGVITISGYSGLPPYLFTWQNADGSLMGSGVIDSNYQEVLIPNLPVGAYTFNMVDSFRDTTFVVNIHEPPPMSGSFSEINTITCVGACDGGLTINISGGTPPYTYTWAHDTTLNTAQLSGLCPDTFLLQVTDARACILNFEQELTDPLPFTATAELLKEVSCFAGSDGQVGVSVVNGVAARYAWSNGATTQSVSGLPAGFYTVTVTSDRFCESTSFIEVEQPDAPLEVSIDKVLDISCGGMLDGALQAQVTGPYQSLQYNWSNGATEALARNLGAGTYSLQIRNERGCTAEAAFLLEEPPIIEASFSAPDLTCLDPPNGGIIYVDAVSGGLGDYSFSVDGQNFTRQPLIGGLRGGAYEVIVQDRTGCRRRFPVTIQPPPELLVSLPDSTVEIHLGDSILLDAQANSDQVIYTWDHDPTISASSVFVAPLISTRFRVRVEDIVTMCRSEATVFVQVNKERRVFIPNAFSPNMDGSNDRFFIYGGSDVAQIVSFRVFTREGHLVFQDAGFQPNDPMHGWDGLFRGQQMSPGTFVYLAEITFVDGLTEVFKGDVVLVR